MRTSSHLTSYISVFTSVKWRWMWHLFQGIAMSIKWINHGSAYSTVPGSCIVLINTSCCCLCLASELSRNWRLHQGCLNGTCLEKARGDRWGGGGKSSAFKSPEKSWSFSCGQSLRISILFNPLRVHHVKCQAG